MPRCFVPCGLLLLTLSVIAASTVAPQPASHSERRAQVLVLGTYHFDNPGLDVVKTEVADVLTPAKQAEITQVIEALARFRLADRFGHRLLYPVDHGGEFPFGAMMQYAQTHDPAFVQRVQQATAEITAESNRHQQQKSIGAILRFANDPARIEKGHAMYVEIARVGAGDSYVGADLLAKWYECNIRIFSELQRMAQPGDRILVIFGAGHAAILRQLIASDPQLELIEATAFLPGAS